MRSTSIRRRFPVVSLAAGLFAAAFVLPAHALPMVAGKKCAGQVSETVNPQTGVKSRSCRTVEGTIATETVTKAKADKGTPKGTAAAPKKTD